MEQKIVKPDMSWVRRLDPNVIHEILMRCAGASKYKQLELVACWRDQEMFMWVFGGNLGLGGKLWRGLKDISGEGLVPHLHVTCYGEHRDAKAHQIIMMTDAELLKVLIRAGLRK